MPFVPWTPEQDRILLELAPTTRADVIAELVGRTTDGVRGRIRFLRARGVDIPQPDPLTKRAVHGTVNPWRPEEDAYLLASIDVETGDVIAKHLGRSYESVRSRLRKLRKDGRPVNGHLSRFGPQPKLPPPLRKDRHTICPLSNKVSADTVASFTDYSPITRQAVVHLSRNPRAVREGAAIPGVVAELWMRAAMREAGVRCN